MPLWQETITNAPRISSNISATAEYDLIKLINIGIAFAIIAAGILSVLYIFIGGLKFIFSGGMEDRVKIAINTIRYAIIGLIVTILSFTIISVVGRVFGLNLTEYISLQAILELVNTFTSNVQYR